MLLTRQTAARQQGLRKPGRSATLPLAVRLPLVLLAGLPQAAPAAAAPTWR